MQVFQLTAIKIDLMETVYNFLRELSIFILPLMLGIILHEVGHGYVAYLLGDPTAKQAGRLTLNPIKHLDPLGLAVLLITRKIGWAKPVPINPAYFKDLKKGLFWVSAAGPAVNFALALIFWLIFKLVPLIMTSSPSFVQIYILYPIYLISSAGVIVNIILGVFNLIPFPPLDGSKMLLYFLPNSWIKKYLELEKFGLVILLVLIFLGYLDHFLTYLLNFIYKYILN
ncbi:MAG: site-2 protease family protein [Desulfonauticus sp.]|nr:site-2 protease family protein [Desulfonauticus sp.]